MILILYQDWKGKKNLCHIAEEFHYLGSDGWSFNLKECSAGQRVSRTPDLIEISIYNLWTRLVEN